MLLRFFLYTGLAFAAVLAVFTMPGWWLALMGAVLAMAIALGIAEGMGLRLAARVSRFLFWPRG